MIRLSPRLLLAIGIACTLCIASGLRVEDDDDLPEPPPAPPAANGVDHKNNIDDDDDDEITVEDVPDPTDPPSFSDRPPGRNKMSRRPRDRNFRADPSYLSENDLAAVELLLACVAAAYCIVFWSGRRGNARIASAWREVMAAECRNHFAQLGVDGSAAALRGSYGTHVFYATGRRYVEFMSATLNLVHRFDVFQCVLRSLVKGDPDVVTLVCALTPEDSGLPPRMTEQQQQSAGPVIACLMLRREVKKMLEKYSDLSTYTETVSSVKVPDKFTMVSNVPEIAASVFSEGFIRKSLFAMQDSLLSVHVTTEGVPDATARGRKRVLTVVFKLPAPDVANDMADVKRAARQGVQLALAMVDGMGRLRLSKDIREAAVRGQRKVEELEYKRQEAARQEAAQNRRIEKERKRKDEVAGMSRDAQIKYEAQRKKKELRKQNSGSRARRVALI